MKLATGSALKAKNTITCSSMTPDSPDWVAWVKRGLLWD